MSSSPDKWVGQSLERFEDEALLTGRARFMDDLEPVAGLCHAAILRSPHGCADILHVDTTAAQALPGVIGVLTPDDVAGMSKPIGNLVSRRLSCLSRRGRTRPLFRRGKSPISNPRKPLHRRRRA